MTVSRGRNPSQMPNLSPLFGIHDPRLDMPSLFNQADHNDDTAHGFLIGMPTFLESNISLVTICLATAAAVLWYRRTFISISVVPPGDLHAKFEKHQSRLPSFSLVPAPQALRSPLCWPDMASRSVSLNKEPVFLVTQKPPTSCDETRGFYTLSAYSIA